MVTVFGIRHHGPGSARSLRAELEKLRPDLLLVEGPPDADGMIPLAGLAEMVPPVALLLTLPDRPQEAVYYPFAEFSPEWQAILFGLRAGIPVRFMDLRQAHQLGVETPEDKGEGLDPFAMVAEAAGYSDGERWWEHFVEQRRESGSVFEGILELMTALRTEAERLPGGVRERDLLREAAMREILRAGQAQGYQRIAVVCGAWHAPVLADLERFSEDTKLLKGLPKQDVAVTWVPWTYDRLARFSGYGAGINSPGWYEHLWQTDEQVVEQWMVKVAQMLRAEDLYVSPAHAIEATRLADTLAALRERPLPGLPELLEAVQAVMCFGDDAPMRLIGEKLLVAQKMGRIPDSAPTVPLQRDLAAQQKRLRLELSASPETIDLDLRKPLLLERSQLLHRLGLLGIPWGQLREARGAKGTFHEIWQVEWKPEFAVVVIEASLWGNTVLEAATNKVQAEATRATELPVLTRLVEGALLADLPEAIPGLLTRVQQAAAISSDILHLMEALPPLANVLRYGNVRNTDASMVAQVVNELVERICIGLPAACQSLDDEAAGEMFEKINQVQGALAVIQNEAHQQAWTGALTHLADQERVHGLVRGRAARLIFDRAPQEEAAAWRMSQALSPGTPTGQSAAWVEGFFYGSGQALIHHPRLWQLMDTWMVELPEEQFRAVLPLLRRVFSTFSSAERRQIGELAKNNGLMVVETGEMEVDPVRAQKALTLVAFILGGESSADQ